MKPSPSFHLTGGILATIATCLAVHSPLHAATVVTNAEDTTSTTTFIEGGSFATSFTTGSGPGWTLDSVELLLGREPGSTAITALNVGILTDNGGVPGIGISNLGGAGLPTTPTLPNVALFTYTPDVPVVLAPNTTYWIRAFTAALPAGERIAWASTTDGSETGLPGWSIGDDRYVLNGSWSEFEPGNPAAFRFAVNATAIPEPSTALLAGLGFFALLRRRRHS